MDDVHAVFCGGLDHGLHAEIGEGGHSGQRTSAVVSDGRGDIQLGGRVDCFEDGAIPEHLELCGYV